MATALTIQQRDLDRYIAEVNRYPLLGREEEAELAQRWREHADLVAAHQLVVANLRFVVKVAYEYRGYGLKLLDIIQEGNIGLMHAVKKFDPAKGYRLISYAVWWIRAQIHEYIMRSWSLVKLGSGRIKRKLFFKLRSERSRAEQEAAEHAGDVKAKELADRLGVGEADVTDMEVRMAARDFSLDAPITDTASVKHLDMLSSEPNQEEQAAHREEERILDAVLGDTVEAMDEKERYVLDQRLLSDDPQSLADIGRHFGFSRERARQIENNVIEKLRRRALAQRDPWRLASVAA